ncbi:hypothetical protein FXW78_22735 [Rhodococcus opacus]|nr:hypothetical protein [Rhodococcus opacus]
MIDALAAAEPLTEQMLADLTTPDAVQAAHSAGLITIEASNQHAVRLAHPMYGEARRAQTTPLRLRKLRSHIATALAATPDTGPRDLIRRAVLTLESDLTPTPSTSPTPPLPRWRRSTRTSPNGSRTPRQRVEQATTRRFFAQSLSDSSAEKTRPKICSHSSPSKTSPTTRSSTSPPFVVQIS